MKNRLFKTAGFFCACAFLAIAVPDRAMADMGPGYQTTSSLLVKVDGMNPALYTQPDTSSEVVGEATTGSTYSVLELVNDSWVRISNGSVEGYLNTAKSATLAETTAEVRDTSSAKRQSLVNYAKQFVGNRYVYGGTNPNTGVDCSGFTSYVMRNAAGVSLPHSSSAQSGYGRTVNASQMQPGDLVFYAKGGRINHVALYIGNGQVVHASNARDGIKISNWTYRTPYKIVNVLGD